MPVDSTFITWVLQLLVGSFVAYGSLAMRSVRDQIVAGKEHQVEQQKRIDAIEQRLSAHELHVAKSLYTEADMRNLFASVLAQSGITERLTRIETELGARRRRGSGT
jgi:hypothetical protein